MLFEGLMLLLLRSVYSLGIELCVDFMSKLLRDVIELEREQVAALADDEQSEEAEEEDDDS